MPSVPHWRHKEPEGRSEDRATAPGRCPGELMSQHLRPRVHAGEDLPTTPKGSIGPRGRIGPGEQALGGTTGPDAQAERRTGLKPSACCISGLRCAPGLRHVRTEHAAEDGGRRLPWQRPCWACYSAESFTEPLAPRGRPAPWGPSGQGDPETRRRI